MKYNSERNFDEVFFLALLHMTVLLFVDALKLLFAWLLLLVL